MYICNETKQNSRNRFHNGIYIIDLIFRRNEINRTFLFISHDLYVEKKINSKYKLFIQFIYQLETREWTRRSTIVYNSNTVYYTNVYIYIYTKSINNYYRFWRNGTCLRCVLWETTVVTFDKMFIIQGILFFLFFVTIQRILMISCKFSNSWKSFNFSNQMSF